MEYWAKTDRLCPGIRGVTRPEAGPFLGEVVVADIGAPRELLEELANQQ